MGKEWHFRVCTAKLLLEKCDNLLPVLLPLCKTPCCVSTEQYCCVSKPSNLNIVLILPSVIKAILYPTAISFISRTILYTRQSLVERHYDWIFCFLLQLLLLLCYIIEL